MRININFMQTGGVPLTNDLMDVIMSAIETYDVLGEMAGNLTILYGCQTIGQSVSPGVVVVDGEVLNFEGGPLYPSVYVNTEEQSEQFQDGTNKALITRKTVKFGNSLTQYNWADFNQLKTLKELQTELAGKANQSQVDAMEIRLQKLEQKTEPIRNGGIVMIWPRTEPIPAGWKECTDLQGKTIFGKSPNDTDFGTVGNPGGTKTKTITQNNLPALSASISIVQPYSGSSQPGGGFDGGGNPWFNRPFNFNFGGNSTPLNILPPYQTVIFIEPNF